MGNERGIALVITLLVVSLLFITVMEFTYSVYVDSHMARNALSGLQASLLARSGINLGEAFLLHDGDPTIDAFTEEWCPQAGPDAHSCNIDETNSQLVVPGNMRLRVRIIDEGAKLNINAIKPRDANEWRQWRIAQQNDSQPPQRMQSWKTAFAQLLSARGLDPQIADAVADYWEAQLEPIYGTQGAPITGATPGATPQTPGPTPANTPNPFALQQDLPSLDDAGIITGLTPSAIRRLRPVVAALPSNSQRTVNANTASREVLQAIVGEDGGSVVDEIISARQDAGGLTPTTLSSLVSRANASSGSQQGATPRNVGAMLGVTSSFFLIRASAIVNPNPVTGRGGVSRSASMLVRRDRRAGVAQNAPAGTPRWTLTQLDWQKEGGAALFQPQVDQEPGGDDQPPAGFPGMGG